MGGGRPPSRLPRFRFSAFCPFKVLMRQTKCLCMGPAEGREGRRWVEAPRARREGPGHEVRRQGTRSGAQIPPGFACPKRQSLLRMPLNAPRRARALPPAATRSDLGGGWRRCPTSAVHHAARSVAIVASSAADIVMGGCLAGWSTRRQPRVPAEGGRAGSSASAVCIKSELRPGIEGAYCYAYVDLIAAGGCDRQGVQGAVMKLYTCSDSRNTLDSAAL